MITTAYWSRMVMMPIIMLTICAVAAVSHGATARVSAGGNHTAAIRADGTLWAWGDNTFGQLGDGTTVSRNVPVKIGTAVNWTSISAGFYHNAAIKSDGTLWVWGDNTKGQLAGASTAFSESVPVKVGADSNWVAVSAGDFHTLALKTDNTLWGWGDNSSGQVGDGSVVPGIRSLPVQLLLPSPLTNNDWIAVAAGGGHSLALKANQTLWAWGFNGAGQLGNGTNLDAGAPVQIVLPAPFTNNDWKAVAAGRLQSLALKTNTTLQSWGNNKSGQLGNGTTLDSDVPVQENSQSATWAAADMGDSHTLGRKSDGTLWAWGKNSSGQLGNGTVADAQTPLQVGADVDWTDEDAGSAHNVALKSNGTIWAWGDNTFGQVGDGTSTPRNAPVPVSPARFSLKGDLNQNGVVDLADVQIALRFSVGLDLPTADNLILGDVAPPNGTIDIADALLILRKVVGLASF